MKISSRLGLLVGAMALLMVAFGAIGLAGIARTNDALQEMYETRLGTVSAVGQFQYLMTRNRLLLGNVLLDPAPNLVEKYTREVDANTAVMDQAWATTMALPMSAESAALAQALSAKRALFAKEGLVPALAALRNADFILAQTIILGRLDQLLEPLRSDSNALVALAQGEALAEYQAATARYRLITTGFIAALLAGLGVSGWIAVSLIRRITRSMLQASEVVHAVALGELGHQIDASGRDEIAAMLRAIAAMQDSLCKTVTAVRQGSDNLAVASAEIASGNADLASRTEQQAGAIEATAASMAQLGMAVRSNADNAQQGSALALRASGVAVEGGDIVGQVVQMMAQINDASRRIGDIIGVIDGIAFQTNILALNAAVEAARAGEQGRGFAVVASEVRSLAGRSAEAAKEIKQLISASVERVGRGTLLVDQAGSKMTEVVGAIRQVADMMGEITQASSRQASDIDQVSQAVGHMDRSTQQNAALVEQMAASAESLKFQAQDLVHTVAVFNLDGNAAVNPQRRQRAGTGAGGDRQLPARSAPPRQLQ